MICLTEIKIWGITVGGAVLQNELRNRLPTEFLDRLPAGNSIVDSAITELPGLSQLLADDVASAFAQSLRRVWWTMTGIAGAGLFASLAMHDIKLHTTVDENWNLRVKEESEQSHMARS